MSRRESHELEVPVGADADEEAAVSAVEDDAAAAAAGQASGDSVLDDAGLPHEEAGGRRSSRPQRMASLAHLQ
jgi:hypothetical protein